MIGNRQRTRMRRLIVSFLVGYLAATGTALLTMEGVEARPAQPSELFDRGAALSSTSQPEVFER